MVAISSVLLDTVSMWLLYKNDGGYLNVEEDGKDILSSKAKENSLACKWALSLCQLRPTNT